METSVLENAAGETLEMTVAQKVAQQGVSMHYQFGYVLLGAIEQSFQFLSCHTSVTNACREDVVTVASSSQGSTYHSEIPKPDPSLYISRRQFLQQFKTRCRAGEKKIVGSVASHPYWRTIFCHDV